MTGAGHGAQRGAEYAPSDQEPVHVFIGVSAIMGVVWCTWGGIDEVMCDGYNGFISLWIQSCVGNDRFFSSASFLCVIDSNQKVVARLDEIHSSSYDFWVTNTKWIVNVEPHENRLVVWVTDDGEPLSSHGVDITGGNLPMRAHGGGFSPFDPGSDELILVGNSRDDDGFICFVDLVRSTGTGVMVMSRESVKLPYASPWDLAWASPNAILTVHKELYDHIVYNTATGEAENFSLRRYHEVYAIPPGLHFAAILRNDSGQLSSFCEVYSASNMSQPLYRYKCNRVQHFALTSSSKQLCVVQTTTCSGPTQTGRRGPASPAFVHDAITGTLLIEVRVSQRCVEQKGESIDSENERETESE
ncbi:hypothetical protein Pelo_16733 [Pelomyxa schiedti]|nr:hypothetical protein Pelo_16733 [Pelomyxa schiedti]